MALFHATTLIDTETLAPFPALCAKVRLQKRCFVAEGEGGVITKHSVGITFRRDASFRVTDTLQLL